MPAALRLRGAILVAVSLGLAVPAAAQQRYATLFSPALAREPQVRDALTWLESTYPDHVREWIHITEIPAKSEHEQARAAYVKAELEKQGLEVRVDSIGNVTAVRKGVGGGPSVVFAAHMDTVHPLDTDVTVKQDGTVLRAPGIFDNSASVANMLAVVRALGRAHVRTKGDLVFVATVQEELGLRGMDWWLEHNPRPGMLVAMDGGLDGVDYGALGIYWTRYHFTGEGSHTLTSTGKPQPARALSEAIASIYELRIPEGRGGAVYNVGMIGGGKVFNAIPQDVWFTVDLRSVNPTLLDSLDQEIEARVAKAAADQRVKWSKELVQRNKAGGTEDQLAGARRNPIVQTAIDIHEFLGLPARAAATGSTDANVAVTRGIPAISIGRSKGGNQHTLQEWADSETALPASKMVLLLGVSLAGLK